MGINWSWSKCLEPIGIGWYIAKGTTTKHPRQTKWYNSSDRTMPKTEPNRRLPKQMCCKFTMSDEASIRSYLGNGWTIYVWQHKLELGKLIKQLLVRIWGKINKKGMWAHTFKNATRCNRRMECDACILFMLRLADFNIIKSNYDRPMF